MTLVQSGSHLRSRSPNTECVGALPRRPRIRVSGEFQGNSSRSLNHLIKPVNGASGVRRTNVPSPRWSRFERYGPTQASCRDSDMASKETSHLCVPIVPPPHGGRPGSLPSRSGNRFPAHSCRTGSASSPATRANSASIASFDIVDKAVRSFFASNEVLGVAARISAAMLGKKDPVCGFGPPRTSPLHIRPSETLWQRSVASGPADIPNESTHVRRSARNRRDKRLVDPETTIDTMSSDRSPSVPTRQSCGSREIV